MKKVRLLATFGLVLLLGIQPLFAQSKKEKKEQKENEVKELLDSGRYTIEVNRALPVGGSSINLTSPYSLELRDDSVISYLPYFGRAYTVPYGGSNGLRFDEPVTNYSITYDKKKKKALVKFEVRTSEDNYTYSVDVFMNGNSIIHVQPLNKQSITFHGEIAPSKEDKKTGKELAWTWD